MAQPQPPPPPKAELFPEFLRDLPTFDGATPGKFLAWKIEVEGALNAAGYAIALTDANAAPHIKAGASRTLTKCLTGTPRSLANSLSADPKALWTKINMLYGIAQAGRREELRVKLYSLTWLDHHTINTFNADVTEILAELNADPQQVEPLDTILYAVRKALPHVLRPFAHDDFGKNNFDEWCFAFTGKLTASSYAPNKTLAELMGSPSGETPRKEVAAAALAYGPDARQSKSLAYGPDARQSKSSHTTLNPDGCRHCEAKYDKVFTNHLSKDCRNRPDAPSVKKNVSNKLKKYDSTHSERALSATTAHPNNVLYLDNGATLTVIRSAKMLNSTKPNTTTSITTANGDKMIVKATGTFPLTMTSQNSTTTVELEALHTPDAAFDLVSLNGLLHTLPKGAEYRQTRTTALIKLARGDVIPFEINNGLVNIPSKHGTALSAKAQTGQSLTLLHPSAGTKRRTSSNSTYSPPRTASCQSSSSSYTHRPESRRFTRRPTRATPRPSCRSSSRTRPQTPRSPSPLRTSRSRPTTRPSYTRPSS